MGAISTSDVNKYNNLSSQMGVQNEGGVGLGDQLKTLETLPILGTVTGASLTIGKGYFAKSVDVGTAASAAFFASTPTAITITGFMAGCHVVGSSGTSIAISQNGSSVAAISIASSATANAIQCASTAVAISVSAGDSITITNSNTAMPAFAKLTFEVV